MPFQREYGKSKFVAVALGKFSVADGFQQQRQMGKLRHGVLPAKGLVEHDMQGSTG